MMFNSDDLSQATNWPQSVRRCTYCDGSVADGRDEHDECFLVSCSSEVAVPVALMHFPVYDTSYAGPSPRQ